jgi:predicted permease
LACIGGILYANLWQGFPPFIDNALKLSSAVALPLALLSIGGALTLTTVRDHFKMSLVSSIFKLMILPAVGYLFLMVFGVSGLVLKVGLIFFALPTSSAVHILSSQLNSDTDLAAASIAMSTMLSFFSLSIVLLL